jgi:hypothetical protein
MHDNMSATNISAIHDGIVQSNTSTWTRNIVTSTWTIQTDNQLVYMSRANAIRANNMSATNMCAVL